MKTLLITNYWRPWNHSGTMRWLQFARYIDFDVLTQIRPREGFYDETLPGIRYRNIYRRFYRLPAIFFGFFITPFILSYRYDLYIFTIPPYSLSFAAYIMAKMARRRVLLDIRDDFRLNKNNHFKFINPIYNFFQKRIKNKTCSFQFLDKNAKVIYSGYNSELENCYVPSWIFVESKREKYLSYLNNIKWGLITDYRKRIDSKYACSSFVNLKYLGFKNLPADCLHNECINQPVQSWKESAKQMIKIMELQIPDKQEKP